MVTPEQLDILRHALGVTEHTRPADLAYPIRSRYVTERGTRDYDLCMHLVDAGLMACRTGNIAPELIGGGELFVVTLEGRRAVAKSIPEPPKLTRSQARYRAWLDADTGVTFGEWLRTRWAR